MNQSSNHNPKILWLVLVSAFVLVVLRNAWLSDDAYITFRTVDNFSNGLGLTWNPAERVQAFTHPLWLFLLSFFYFFTNEIYLTSIFLSVAVSATAVFLLVRYGATTPETAVLVTLILLLSKAFIDYATSGLENPLTHLLLITFLILYTRSPIPNPRSLFLLSLLAALGILNRMDTALLFLPPLAVAFWHAPLSWRSRLKWVLLGFSPLILWELFSLFYFGFPFPNTAYAKLNPGLINRQELTWQGVYYFLNSLNWDPLTLLVIGVGLLLPVLLRQWRWLPLTLGMALYLAYIVRIGGDFMSGRFLAAPLLIALFLLARQQWHGRQPVFWACLGLVLLIGWQAPYAPASNRSNQQPLTDKNGITDEKGNYWSSTGLLNLNRITPLPDHAWASKGREARRNNPGIVSVGSIGFYGFLAGPDVHVVDLLGLADPLTARLPPADPIWRPGHYGRRLPAGYEATLASGQNQIVDPVLAGYYDRLALVTRGPLFSWERLQTIIGFNTGRYDADLHQFAWLEGEELTFDLTLTNPTTKPFVYAFVWNNDHSEAFLLDEQSAPGKRYPVTWTLRADGLQFNGEMIRNISQIGLLADATTLNMGLIVSDTPDLSVYEIFEHRYWFNLKENGQFVMLRQAEPWFNTAAPGGTWVKTDVGHALTINHK